MSIAVDTSDIYKKLFDLSLDMLCVVNVEGYFEVLNPAFTQLLGYEEAELLAQPFASFIHPDDVEATESAVAKLYHGHTITHFQNRYRHANGTYRVLLWSSRVDQATGKIYAVARDHTELLQAQSKVTQMERVLDSEIIMSLTDKNGVITYVNEKFCEISGYTRDELIGKTHKLINSGKHPKEFFTDLWNRIKSGKTWTGLIENKKKNGDEYFVQTIISPIIDIDRVVKNYLAIRFEVTSSVQTKRHLRKTLDILNETSSIAKVGGWELEVATGELTWTDETFKILEVEKMAGQKPVLPEGLDLFVDEHKPVIERAVARAIDPGEPYNLELLAKTAKGNVLWVHTNGKPNYEDGKIVTVSGTIQDIDAQKKAEMLFEQARQKSAQNAKLASLGELAAGVAHEINNPLAIIKGAARLLPKFRDSPEKFASKLDAIDKSCERIAKIVSSLNKLSRSNDKRQFANHSLAKIITEVMTLTEIKAKRHDVQVELRCVDEANILCDDLEVERVAINLVNNAIDEIKNNVERWIKIDVFSEDQQVIFAVTDAGNGMSDDVKKKLFDPFFTTKQTGQGTGLGLSIARGILDEHEATIFVDESAANTRFVVAFPRPKA